MIMLMETHTSGSGAKRIAKRCGLDSLYIVDALGQSGGIWCLWNSDVWNVDIISSSSQLIHMKLSYKGNPHWFLTTCYGSPHYAIRQDLWRQIRDIHAEINDLWVVIGDLNAITSAQERAGPQLLTPLR